MGNKIIFSSVKSNADNRLPEKDDKGYYLVVLGALNVVNSAGEFYTAKDVKELFTNSNSTLLRRIRNGALRGEVGHPKYVSGMSKTEYFNRNLRIDEENVCVHIRELILEETGDTESVPGEGNIILVKGWVTPSGPKGDFLAKAFENPEENVAFSVRSFTKNEFKNGVTVKKIVQLVTYDYVNEPGISQATKFKSLGIESLDSVIIDMDDISNGDDVDECFACSLESNDSLEMVKELIHNVNSNTDVMDGWYKI